MLRNYQQSVARSILTTQWTKLHNVVSQLSTSSALCESANYYDTLEIPKDSTQRDIKSAYYKLSMQYHPDKNQGSEEAAKKFRQITKAYEVLGNYKQRRLYDKGVGTDFASTVDISRHDEVVPEDDDETKFYKSRFRKSTVPSEGRTPIYDFDEWSRSHYGKSFERKQTAQKKYERKQNEKQQFKASVENEIVIISCVAMLVVSYLVFHQQSQYDTPVPKSNSSDKSVK